MLTFSYFFFKKSFQGNKNGLLCSFVGEDLGGLLLFSLNHFVPTCLSGTNLDVYSNFQSSFK